MNKAILSFAALSLVLGAQVSRADGTVSNGNDNADNQSVVMVNTTTNETIRVDQNGVVTPVSDAELTAIDNQINTSDDESVMHTAAYVGGGVHVGPVGGGIGINRCGVNFGVHVGPIGIGAGGAACRGFWRGGRWHHGYWHHRHGRWAGAWARLF